MSVVQCFSSNHKIQIDWFWGFTVLCFGNVLADGKMGSVQTNQFCMLQEVELLSTLSVQLQEEDTFSYFEESELQLEVYDTQETGV